MNGDVCHFSLSKGDLAVLNFCQKCEAWCKKEDGEKGGGGGRNFTCFLIYIYSSRFSDRLENVENHGLTAGADGSHVLLFIDFPFQ